MEKREGGREGPGRCAEAKCRREASGSGEEAGDSVGAGRKSQGGRGQSEEDYTCARGLPRTGSPAARALGFPVPSAKGTTNLTGQAPRMETSTLWVWFLPALA